MPALVCSRWRRPSELSAFGLRPAPWHLEGTVHRLPPAPLSGAYGGAAGELGTASWTSTAVILILRGVAEQAPPAELTPRQGSGQQAWLALEATPQWSGTETHLHLHLLPAHQLCSEEACVLPLTINCSRSMCLLSFSHNYGSVLQPLSFSS